VSHDGKYLLFGANEPETGADLWILPLSGSGERQPKAYLQNRYDEAEGAFSPDGRWIAYVSDETGRAEVYVQPFAAGSGSKWQVSTEGGEQPKWRADGKEIFYLSAGRFMAVEVKAGPQFQAGQPRPLFEDLNLGAHTLTAGGSHYAVSGDGKRVLIFEPISSNTEPSLTVVVNWTAGLKK
jgi:dipeptidyl aminopeptidase/acylaminoacyl peptidase